MRERIGETSLTALTAEVAAVRQGDAVGSGEEEVVVRHEDGRTWSVRAGKVGTGVDLAESCGKRAIAAQEWLLRLV